MSVNGIEIKLGQTWLTRGGAVVTVEEIDLSDPHDKYPVYIGNANYLTLDGRYWPSDPNMSDLVELISEEKAYAESLAVETLVGLGYVFDGQCWVQDTPAAYDKLADVLNRALHQASQGKGKERHASGDIPFEEQPMATINRQLGSVHGFIFQAHKKSLESLRLPAGRDVAELLGAINYLAGAVIAIESWAKKGEV